RRYHHLPLHRRTERNGSMSYTVIVIEDEKILREELVHTTPWKELELKVIGTAEDGISGEALIRDLDPDIVITDIRLPGQDGLTMLSKAPVSHAVILSGHTDFSYMQQAIRLSVFDYLLKPIEDKDLEASLKALVKKIKEEDQELSHLKFGDPSGDEPISLKRNTGHRLVDGCIGFIGRNYQDPVGLKEAAETLGISESHLSRIFKEVTGLNFMHYLNAWRINKAITIMKDPRINIGETASLCGFPTPGYFAKIFRRYTGRTPSQHREMNQGTL
ncbi:helix-turn-helix domain-containing protein, partial [Treponema sp. OttesenSCG-928-L16]|nr:helix-turn-helix domain-containing protein [Treponema sp. OttesenSCG-928-L16]